MVLCPFCGQEISWGKTSCLSCGYPVSLALPNPSIKTGFSNLLLVSLGLICGIGSCIFSLIPSLNYLGFILVLSAVTLSGITLEILAKKFNSVHLKVLSVVALIFAAVGYIIFVFINSRMPGSGSHA